MRLWILNKRGEVKIASNKNDIGRKIEKSDPTCQVCHAKKPEIRQSDLIYDKEPKKFYRNILPIHNKNECQRCHSPSETLTGVILVDYSMDEFNQWLENLRGRFIYSFLVVLLIIASLSYMVIEILIIRRLDILEKGVTRFGKGELKNPIEIKSRDEIGHLTTTINDMASRLDALYSNLEGMVEKKTREVKESEKRYRGILEKTPNAMVIFDAKTLLFENVNRAAIDLYGYTEAEFLSLTPMDVSAEAENTKKAVQNVLAEKYTHVPIRYHKKKDGTVFPTEIFMGTFFSGGRNKCFAVIVDMTEVKKAEKILKQRLDELEQFRKVTIKRELRMEELKKRVEELERKLGVRS
jgi:PAS domain S-box-containing protein